MGSVPCSCLFQLTGESDGFRLAHMQVVPNRRRAGLLVVCAAILVVVAAHGRYLRDFVSSRLDGVIERMEAHRTLRQWGVDPSAMNIQRFLMTHTLTPLERYADSRLSQMTGKARGGEDEQFSERWSYRDLRDDDQVRIGVYSQSPFARAQLEELLSRHGSTWGAAGIRMTSAANASEFRSCLADCDIVFYFGHANRGRGLLFGELASTGEWFRMGAAELEMPLKAVLPGDERLGFESNGFVRIRGGAEDLPGLVVRCKVLWLMGCRTEGYYRAIWSQQFPDAELVTSNYAWDSTAEAAGIIQTLAEGVMRGIPLRSIIEFLNSDRGMEILHGTRKEISDYGNRGPFPEELLVY